MSEVCVCDRLAHRWAPDFSRRFGNLPDVIDQLVSPDVAPASELIDLSGRRVLVTGGGKGIGAAIARRLVDAGAVVTVGDLDAGSAAAVEASGATFVRCDITIAGDVEAAVRAAAGEEDRLDIVVNNAGIFPTTGPMLDASDDFVSRMLDVNVRATPRRSR
jgi:2-deoxy-D-gluconate 3-dehydrogenase